MKMWRDRDSMFCILDCLSLKLKALEEKCANYFSKLLRLHSLSAKIMQFYLIAGGQRRDIQSSARTSYRMRDLTTNKI
jgi:hypothetical protein